MSMEIYLEHSDIKEFLDSNKEVKEGVSYSWENEDVFHIHLIPLSHAFGVRQRCLFVRCCKDIETFMSENECNVVVVVNEDSGDTKVFVKTDNNIEEVLPKFIPLKDDLHSRSKGLLEIDALRDRHLVVIGLGSFGSQIAIECAKSGIGEFSIFDFDRVELHNLARHSSFLKDLGRLKTDVINDAILGKNPYAKVNKYPININENNTLLEEAIKKCDLVICATDNNESRFVVSKLLCKLQKPGIFGRAITRAAGGDVFRYTPSGPCYSCLIGSSIINANDEEISSEQAGRRSGHIPAYASSQDVNAVVQVGLSSDIEPICNLMVKLALLELSKGTNSGISSLEDDFIYDAYIWANRRDNNFSHWHEFYKAGNKQTILRWYGINIFKDKRCPICSSEIVLETDFESPIKLNNNLSNHKISLD